MTVLFTNNAATNLASSITSSATSLTVTAGTGSLFPTPSNNNYFLLTLQGISGTPIEIVQCTARSGDTLTIVRAQEGTTASAFTGGDTVQLRITAGEMTSILAGSARGNGTDQVFFENGNTVNYSYTITAGKNAMCAGPLTIATGVTLTTPSGSRLVIV
jgi:hypothetical protein